MYIKKATAKIHKVSSNSLIYLISKDDNPDNGKTPAYMVTGSMKNFKKVCGENANPSANDILEVDLQITKDDKYRTWVVLKMFHSVTKA